MIIILLLLLIIINYKEIVNFMSRNYIFENKFISFKEIIKFSLYLNSIKNQFDSNYYYLKNNFDDIITPYLHEEISTDNVHLLKVLI